MNERTNAWFSVHAAYWVRQMEVCVVLLAGGLIGCGRGPALDKALSLEDARGEMPRGALSEMGESGESESGPSFAECRAESDCGDGEYVEPLCSPDCAGKECGNDGCGGSCGACTGCGEECADGVCLFAACDGKECGADWCGGTCGTCEADGTCYAGACLPSVDACLNQEDLAIIQDQAAMLGTEADDCAAGCVGSEATPYIDCATPCMEETTGLSAGCSICYLGKSKCTAVHCPEDCLEGSNSSAPVCIACQEENGCSDTFYACSGLMPDE